MEKLVEKTLHRSLDDSERQHLSPNCFQNHLRRKILDGLEDGLRLWKPPTKDPAHPRSSTLEKAIGRRPYDRYESALRKLSDEDREVVIARIELNFPYSKVAEVLGKSGPDEAREAVIQALLQLAKEMGSST
jgi:DNA-directed RNA polymerase specialized sigma24 family protein